MNILNTLINEDCILVVPEELNSYFLEIRKLYPRTHFKLFTLRNLIRELRGNYLDKEAVNACFDIFSDYTYAGIKEILEILFYSFNIETCDDGRFIELKNKLEEKKLLKIDEEVCLLLKNKRVLFVNYERSNVVHNLIKKLNLKNYKFIKLNDVIDVSTTRYYHYFFNIADETHYGLVELLNDIYENEDVNKAKVVLDTSRFQFYLQLYLTNINIPYRIKNTTSLLDTKIYKELMLKINDDFKVLDYLDSVKDYYKNDQLFDNVYDLLKDYNIDLRKNKKVNIYEILSSKSMYEDNYSNYLDFDSKIVFSCINNIYVFGLDSNFVPNAKKDNKVFSYAFKEKMGLDSLDQINEMTQNLEQAFLSQKSIKYVSYHLKDNSGMNNLSYYIKALNYIPCKNKLHQFEYDEEIAKVYYSSLKNKYLLSGEHADELALYYEYFLDKPIKMYSPDFKKIDNYKFNNEKIYSYSSLNSYYECPFKFYLSNILRLGIFTETIFTRFGNIAHKIMENVYDDDFNFEKRASDAIGEIYKDESLIPAKDKMLLNRFLFEVEDVTKMIREHKNNMSYKTSYSEYEIINTIPLEYEGVLNDGIVNKSYQIKLLSRVDKIIKLQNDDIYVVDYKTGTTTFSYKTFIERGENAQLPFYYFMIRNSNDEKLKDCSLNGVFIQHLLKNNEDLYNIYSPSNIVLESIKLSGIFYNDFDSYRSFDYSLERKTEQEGAELTSDFVAKSKLNSKKVKGKWKFNASSKGGVSNEELTSLEKVLKNYIYNNLYGIESGIFNITPISDLVKSGKSKCSFCDFKDICMKKIKKGEDDEQN